MTSTNDGFVSKAASCSSLRSLSKVSDADGDAPGRRGAGFQRPPIPLNEAGSERAPAVAWLRYWVYAIKHALLFFGDTASCARAPGPTSSQNTDFDGAVRRGARQACSRIAILDGSTLFTFFQTH